MEFRKGRFRIEVSVYLLYSETQNYMRILSIVEESKWNSNRPGWKTVTQTHRQTQRQTHSLTQTETQADTEAGTQTETLTETQTKSQIATALGSYSDVQRTVFRHVGWFATFWFVLQFRLTMHYLSEMTTGQTLVIYSGHPLGLFPSHPDAPRVVITNGMVSRRLYTAS